jgi:hypothetical protein
VNYQIITVEYTDNENTKGKSEMEGFDAFNILRKLRTETSILARTCMNQN